MNDELKSISDKLEGISTRLGEMRQEHIRDKYENLSYILWGFTLAMIGLTIANPHPANIVISIAFFIMGLWIMWFRVRRVRTKQDAGNQITIGVKRRLIRLARGFEWAFGAVLMTAITVIVSLQYLSGSARWLLLIGLFIFLAATLVVRFDKAGWFDRRDRE